MHTTPFKSQAVCKPAQARSARVVTQAANKDGWGEVSKKAAAMLAAPLVFFSAGNAQAFDLPAAARDKLEASLPDAATDSVPLSEYQKDKREGQANLPDLKGAAENLVDKAKEGIAAAPEQGGSRQTIAGEVKSGDGYDSKKGDMPDIRPPGLTDKAVANSTPTKERTGEGVKTSSKF